MKRIICIASVVFLCAFLFAKENIPSGYGGIQLGMSVDTVKQKLKENSDFGYHGDKDVSLLPGENRVLIETDAESGYSFGFLERCWFQFYNDKLYVITININTPSLILFVKNMEIRTQLVPKNQFGQTKTFP